MDYTAQYFKVLEGVRSAHASIGCRFPAAESFVSSAVKSAADVSSPLILCLVGTGEMVSLLSKYRPRASIIAITDSKMLACLFANMRGVTSLVEPAVAELAVEE